MKLPFLKWQPISASGISVLALVLTATALAALIAFGSPIFLAAGIGALIVVPLAMRDPKVALWLTVAAIPLEEAGVLAQAGFLGRLSLAKIFGALAIVSWLWNTLIKQKRLVVSKAGMMLACFLATGILSLFGAPEFEAGTTMVFRWLNTILFFLLIINVADSLQTIKHLLVVFLVVSLGVSVFAVVQRMLPQYQYSQRGASEIAEGVQFGAQEDVIEEERVGQAVLRSGGTSYHPLVLAFNSTLLLPLLVVLAARTRNQTLRWMAILGLIIDGAALLATGSRSGILSFLATGIVLAMKRTFTFNRFIISALFLVPIIGWPFIPDSIKERVFSADAYKLESSSSLTYRAEMFSAGAQVFGEHPLLGIGLGNLTEIGKRMKSDVLDDLASGVHNMYLQVALETGIAGLACILAFFWLSLRAAKQAEMQAIAANRHDAAWLARALSCSIWAVLIYGLSLDLMNLSIKNAWLLLALTIALLRAVSPPTPALKTTPAQGAQLAL